MRLIREMLSMILVAAMVFALGIISVNATEESSTLTLTPVQAMPGEEFSTTLCVAEGSEIVDFQVELIYDSDLVHLVSAEQNIDSEGDVVINSARDGELKIDYTLSSKNTSEQMPVADLVFKVDDNAGIGSYVFLQENTTANNIADRLVGSQKIEVPLTCDFEELDLFETGDIDLNKTVEIRDVTHLRRYLVNLQELSDYQLRLADAYYDEDINIRDAVYIQQLLACYDVKLGKRANVYFYATDGSLIATRSVPRGEKLTNIPTVPGSEGYENGVWSTSMTELDDPDFSNISMDLKVYALYFNDEYHNRALYFDSNGGVCEETYRKEGDVSLTDSFPIPTREGFTFDGWYTEAIGGTQINEENIENQWRGEDSMTIYAHWCIIPYELSFSRGTGYTIKVERISSPIANAPTEILNNRDAIYFGDLLSVSYIASPGYTITSNGETSITVIGNVTENEIYAYAKLATYSYTIRYKSVNGTNLGTCNGTAYYSKKITINPPEISGYLKPEPKTVIINRDNMTFEFVYSIPQNNSPEIISSGDWWVYQDDAKITYQVFAEYRNRTAKTVQVRICWKQFLKAGAYYPVSQFFGGCIDSGVSIGEYQITSNTTWNTESSYDRTQEVYSSWFTIPVSATQSQIELHGDWWDSNGLSGTWDGSLPIQGY